MDNGKLTAKEVVFLDIRKAFDSIDHSILLEKVEYYRVTDRELMWLSPILWPKQQQCFVNGHVSSQRNLLC